MAPATWSGYVPRCTSAERVILTVTGSKLAPGELHEDEHGQHDKTHNKPVTIGWGVVGH